MPQYIIDKDHVYQFTSTGAAELNVMEIFYDTIQGEGAYSGCPAVFLRLQGCTLDCTWCDTEWRKGRRIPVDTLLNMLQTNGILDRLFDGHHLVITGGSPLKQQGALIALLDLISNTIGRNAFVEVENECTLSPSDEFCKYVNVWNNSPKLANSGMKKNARIKEAVIRQLVEFHSSYFKFVVKDENDWDEIREDYIKPFNIPLQSVLLMPLGATFEEQQMRMRHICKIAIREGVRYTSREQLVLDVP